MGIARVITLICLMVAPWLAGAGEVAPEAVERLIGLMKTKEHAAALTTADELLAAAPGEVRVRFLKGVILTELKRTPEAEALFSSLIKEYPELPEPYNNLAVLLVERGDLEGARKLLLDAIKTHPSYGIAYENLGDIYARMASEAYGKALSIPSATPAATAKLALIRQMFTQPGPPGKVAETPGAAKPIPQVTTVAGGYSLVQHDKAKTEVEAVVREWALAWSRQQVKRYLGFYSAEFAPQGMSREAWAESRSERIRKPKSIKVELAHLEVEITGDKQASVSFVQEYSSDSYRDRTKKRLVLSKESGVWKIAREVAE